MVVTSDSPDGANVPRKRGRGRPRKNKVTEEVAKNEVKAEDVFSGAIDTRKTDQASMQVESAKGPVLQVRQDVIMPDSTDRVLLKMERTNFSWTTRKNVVFTKDHPYQLVDDEEAEELIGDGFRRADPEEVVKHYQV